jgi:hypothetical protein
MSKGTLITLFFVSDYWSCSHFYIFHGQIPTSNDGQKIKKQTNRQIGKTERQTNQEVSVTKLISKETSHPKLVLNAKEYCKTFQIYAPNFDFEKTRTS